MKTLKWLTISFVVCCLFTGSAAAQVELHGISFLKGAISPVEVGDPYEPSS